MTTKSRAVGFQTTTGGSTSRAHQMDLAAEILASARPMPANQSWLSGLTDEHRNAILDVRESWRQTHQATGISASQMARTIVDKLTVRGYANLSKYRQVQRWLTQG